MSNIVMEKDIAHTHEQGHEDAGSLSLFWHFLDVVWICVFTVVYLLGVV